MGANGNMRSRKSTCLYLGKEIVETTRRAGLNISRESSTVNDIAMLPLDIRAKTPV